MINKFLQFLFLLFRDPLKFAKVLICKIRSLYYSHYIDEGSGEIILCDPFIRIKVKKSKGSKLILNGKLRILPHIGGTTPIRIFLGANSSLIIKNDFVIGQGVRISLNESAVLSFGGKKVESGSGITADTIIMVYKKIVIGDDFVCSWNVFISDSDWHRINTNPHQADIQIDDHVWIANNCSILKGSQIGSNSIVASHSKVINKAFPQNSIIAGIPAKVVTTGINWARDL